MAAFSQTSSHGHERLMRKCQALQAELEERCSLLKSHKQVIIGFLLLIGTVNTSVCVLGWVWLY
jgi:hypothetical protein